MSIKKNMNQNKDEKFEKATKASNELLKILKELTIWKIGKFDRQLEEIKETLKENDSDYSARAFMFEELMSIPRYKKMDKLDKIKIAMKIGSLDTSDLSYCKKAN